jgi:hypothetical protein
MMERAVEPSADAEEWDWPEVKIPRPRENGTYSIESLGRWIDKLMGSEKVRREAAEYLEPFLMKEEDMPPDPEPVEIPPTLPIAERRS